MVIFDIELEMKKKDRFSLLYFSKTKKNGIIYLSRDDVSVRLSTSIARRSLYISYTYHGIEINLDDEIVILRRFYKKTD